MGRRGKLCRPVRELVGLFRGGVYSPPNLWGHFLQRALSAVRVATSEGLRQFGLGIEALGVCPDVWVSVQRKQAIFGSVVLLVGPLQVALKGVSGKWTWG